MEAARPPSKAKNASPIGFLAGGLVRRLLISDGVVIARIQRIWDNVAGRPLKGRSWPQRLMPYRHVKHQRTLEVYCTAGAASYLALEKQRILDAIENELKYSHVCDIKWTNKAIAAKQGKSD